MLDEGMELCASPINLVDKDDRWNTQLHEESHEEFCLSLNAFHGRYQQNRSIQNTEGTLNLRDKVRVPRGIDQIDFQILYEKGNDQMWNEIVMYNEE